MIYNNLIEHKKIRSQLNEMVKNKKLPHAMLFHGSEGSGKEGHAIELAALLNNHQNQNNLIKIRKFQHPNINLIVPMPREKSINKNADALKALSDKSLENLIEMKKNKMINPYKNITFDKKSTILINSIRDIKKDLHFSVDGGAKVHLIFNAEKLCYPKNEAGNALLKILEEPPKNTFFILVTDHKEKMLDTILSRCCDFYFPKVTKSKIDTYFKNDTLNNELDLLMAITNHSIKQIQNIIESDIEIQSYIDDSKNLISKLMQDSDYDSNVKKIEKLFKSNKIHFKIFIKILIIILNDLEKIKNKHFDCLILTDVKKTKFVDYNKCIDLIEQTYHQLNRNANPSMSIFSMMIKMKKILSN